MSPLIGARSRFQFRGLLQALVWPLPVQIRVPAAPCDTLNLLVVAAVRPPPETLRV